MFGFLFYLFLFWKCFYFFCVRDDIMELINLIYFKYMRVFKKFEELNEILWIQFKKVIDQ